ncbi:MAG: agmatine deiminase family protein [Candidatus Omnitrophica bacterium]|nr:agmatine deiminase family protein [Candidatus Omnitrophota bacterium]
MKKIAHLPHELGFRMPAEWELHEATWMVWPHQRSSWQGRDRLERVRKRLLDIFEVLLNDEKVNLLVQNQAEKIDIQKQLKDRGGPFKRLQFYLISTADVWIRDYGPIFIRNPEGRKAWVKWQFNAWGRKYPERLKDNQVFSPRRPFFRMPCYFPDQVLEGGAIDVNGEGEGLTTESCLLHPNRNPGFSKREIEISLRQYLGIRNIVWLSGGIAGDDTDGHVDNLARFVSKDTILAAYEKKTADENYEPLRKNWRRLKAASLRRTRPYELVKLPMPGRVMHGRTRLPASYANFYIANQVVLLPVFEDPQDDKAIQIIKEHFPKKRIVPIPARDIVFGLGTIHCLTQQEPK